MSTSLSVNELNVYRRLSDGRQVLARRMKSWHRLPMQVGPVEPDPRR